MAQKNKETEVIVALYHGRIQGWFGGDGTMIPVWETDSTGKRESKMFLKWNKYHRPKLAKAKIIITKIYD